VNKKTNPNRAHKFDTNGARWMVLTLSVASTLGFWAVFSKVSYDPSAAAGSAGQSSGDVPPTRAETEFVLDLQPLPTLIPPLDPSLANLSNPPVLFPNSVNLSQPSTPLTGKIYLGGSKPSFGALAPAARPFAPITSTGSSK
jgi:hypothetical protein